MSQYRTGTVNVLQNNATITGNGTTWLGNVSAGSVFTVLGSSVPYMVGNVSGNGTATLTAPYAGANANGLSYALTTSFTPILGIPYMEQGDVDTATIFKEAMLLIEDLVMTDVDEIDAGERLAMAFRPEPQTVANMSVHLRAGFLFRNGALTEVAAQNTANITAPSGNARIDRVVIDSLTGVVSVITGNEAASPVAPAITAGKLPVARVALAVGQSSIVTGNITDERIYFEKEGGTFEMPFSASAMTPRNSNGSASLSMTAGAANQPDIPYLAFDGSVKEFASLPPFKLPNSYDSGVITASFIWRRASGNTAANVVWGMRAVAVADQGSPAVAYGSDATVTDGAPTTAANMAVSGSTANCTIAGTPAPGKIAFIEVFRDGAAAGDTLDGVDAWLTGVSIKIGMNKSDDA